MLKKLALLAIAVSFALTANADTFIASDAANTTNDSGTQGLVNAGPTQDIAQHPAWAAPLPGSSWISYAVTGDPSLSNYYVVPNGTSVTFSQTFNLDSPATGGTLSVMADDTTSVILNNVTIYAAALGGSYPTCSSQPIGCLTSTAATIDLSAFLNDFNTGLNTISFQVYQEAGASFGLDYAGTVSTPEPGMLAMLGIGLAGLFLLGRRRNFAPGLAE